MASCATSAGWITSASSWEIWTNDRQRWRIEETFRFLQREGLHWEDFKALSLEAIRRLVNGVLMAALFLLNLRLYVDRALHHLLLILGSKQGLKSERDGLCLLSGAEGTAETAGLYRHPGRTETVW